jgi:enoyl-CoA hydratase/carnithine racemase
MESEAQHSKHISIICKNQHVIITLTRPEKANALNAAMIESMHHCITTLPPSTKSVSLCSKGPVFCAGMDLTMMHNCGQDKVLNQRNATQMAQLFHAWYHLPCLTICFIQGACYGGGLGFAAAADWVIAAKKATFCCPEIKHGLMPALIAPYLNYALGQRFTTAMATHGKPLSATLLYQRGLITQLCTSWNTQTILEETLTNIDSDWATICTFKAYNKKPLPLKIHSINALVQARQAYVEESKLFSAITLPPNNKKDSPD